MGRSAMANAINKTTLDSTTVKEWAREEAPSNVIETPSMMTNEELRFLYNMTRKLFEGRGIIIDAGIFLGASTVAFGQALHDRGFTERLIESFEVGVFNKHTAMFAGLRLDDSFEEGETFTDQIENNIAPVRHLVNLNIGDMLKQCIERKPIEICFLDVLKIPDLNKYVLDNFFPLFIQEQTIVIHQDYFHEAHPWIQATMAYSFDYFEYIGTPHIETSPDMAVFRCLGIPEASPQVTDPFTQPDVEVVADLIGRCLKWHQVPYERLMIYAARATAIARKTGDYKAALISFADAYKEDGISKLLETEFGKSRLKRIKQTTHRFAKIGSLSNSRILRPSGS